MSIVGMRRNMQSWFKYVMYGIAVVFALGVFGYGLSGPDRDKGQRESGAVAKINGEEIDRQTFEMTFRQRIKQAEQQMGGGRLNAFQESMQRGQLFDELVSRTLQTQVAKKEGVKVSKRDISRKIDEVVNQQIEAEREQLLGSQAADQEVNKDKKDEKAAKVDMSDKAFEKELKKYGYTIAKLKTEIKGSLDPELVREQLMLERLVEKWRSSVDSSEENVKTSYDEVRFKQLTIGTGSRSEAQAEEMAKELVAKLRGGADFAAAVKEHSEDSFKENGGDRGYPMRRAYMESELANAVSKLKVGEISDPVKMPLGYTIVKLTEKKSALPEDFNDAEKKKEYIKAYQDQELSRMQREKMDEFEKSAKIEVLDYELKGYMLIKEVLPYSALPPAEKKAKLEQAIAEYQNAVDHAGGRTDITARSYVQMAYLYDQLSTPGMFEATEEERTKYKAEMKKAVLNALDNTESEDLRAMMAEMLIEEKKYQEAMEQLEYVAESGHNNPQAHYILLTMYERMKDSGIPNIATLIKQEKDWLDNYQKQMREQEAAMNSQQIQVVPEPQDDERPRSGG